MFIAGQTYLITKDLELTLERKAGLLLNQRISEKISRLEDEFLTQFWEYIPKDKTRTEIDAKSAARELERIRISSDTPSISLDRVYVKNADAYIEATRITDAASGKVRIGQRPGNPPLEEQIQAIAKYGRIRLFDAGAFGGDTLSEVCKKINRAGIRIDEIILGFLGNSANMKLKKEYPVRAIYIFEFYEWIELRALFGIDGRRAKRISENAFIPYWENLTEWASVPAENTQKARELCQRYNKLLIKALEDGGCDAKKIGTPIPYTGGK